jgi:hypothetical protein
VQYALGGLAAAAAVAAVGFGLWAGSLSNQLEEAEAVRDILADPDARSTELSGADGRLVVSGDGEAVLVVGGLDAAPSGKDYEVWVIDGETPRRAGLFQGDESEDVVQLEERVPAGAVVAVTVEADGGVDAPTTDPIFSARA